jgi:hypothetical protein
MIKMSKFDWLIKIKHGAHFFWPNGARFHIIVQNKYAGKTRTKKRDSLKSHQNRNYYKRYA